MKAAVTRDAGNGWAQRLGQQAERMCRCISGPGHLVMALSLTLGLAACQSEPEPTANSASNQLADPASDSAPEMATEMAPERLTDSVQSGETVSVGPSADESAIIAGDDTDWPAARFATAGLIPAVDQRAGDVMAGRQALLENAYVSCGLPERVFRQLLDGTEPMEIEGRDASADGLPFNVNVFSDAQGSRIVSSNCLTCHATPLFGELVVGLGNEFLDFTADASALAERAGLLVNGPSETAAWERYADRIAAIAPYIRPHTVGVNPANNLTFALIAHRNAEDNAWSEQPLLPLPPTDPPPVSVPPWWRMQKKPAMFNLGEGRRDHARMMMAASMLCTDTVEELESIDAYAPDIRAFIASLEAPAWPFDVDSELAAEGRQLFEQTCSRCHGTYGDEPVYPGRLVPLETIGTDATLVEFAYGEGAPYIDWFNRSYYGELATAAPGPGYVAPPLDGIWASAPFLHNGSVPSLRAMLDSRRRPSVWRHTVSDASDPASYDQVNMGWTFDIPVEAKSEADDATRIYDTSLPGYGNGGHLFGDHFVDAQRSAVLEYLKTL